VDRFLFGFTASAQRSNSLISTPNKQELRTSDDPSAATADRARRSNAEVTIECADSRSRRLHARHLIVQDERDPQAE